MRKPRNLVLTTELSMLASDTISNKPEKNEKKIKKAVEKMFKKYPPQEKK